MNREAIKISCDIRVLKTIQGRSTLGMLKTASTVNIPHLYTGSSASIPQR